MIPTQILIFLNIICSVSVVHQRLETLSSLPGIDYAILQIPSSPKYNFILTNEANLWWKFLRCQGCLNAEDISGQKLQCVRFKRLDIELWNKILNSSISIQVSCAANSYIINTMCNLTQKRGISSADVFWDNKQKTSEYRFCIRRSESESFECRIVTTDSNSYTYRDLEWQTKYQICFAIFMDNNQTIRSSGYKCGEIGSYFPTTKPSDVKVQKRALHWIILTAIVLVVLVALVVLTAIILKKKKITKLYSIILQSKEENLDEESYIEEFKKLKVDSLKAEFDKQLTTDVGQRLVNVKKNRMSDIIPFDQTRVILRHKQLPNDYINASWIPFKYNRNKAEFIAAQDPMVQCISDFWEMIWQENVNLIVMLSMVRNGDKDTNCVQYWPNETNKKYTFGHSNEIVVYLKNEDDKDVYIERQMIIENKTENRSREIIQLQMSSWCSNETPKLDDVDKLMARFQELKESSKEPPYLIHCRNGVGPTGVFICLNRLTKCLSSGYDRLTIYDTIVELRQYRRHFVETQKQYSFIHYFFKRSEMNSVDI